MDDLSKQIDEMEALNSIYDNDWKTVDAASRSYSFTMSNKTFGEVILYLNLPSDYPSMSPPEFQLSAPNVNRNMKQNIALSLNDIYLDNIGEPIIYQWIEKVREILEEHESNAETEHSENIENTINVKDNLEKVENLEQKISHGSLIQDRKSTFQAHCAHVDSKEDVQNIMDHLLSNRKIAQATHNILAYRIQCANGLLQDCDDDGETNASSRVLHLLNILDVVNVMVVVTRWYGGIHLGPDRFKHINNAARQVLEVAGYIHSKK